MAVVATIQLMCLMKVGTYCFFTGPIPPPPIYVTLTATILLAALA